MLREESYARERARRELKLGQSPKSQEAFRSSFQLIHAPHWEVWPVFPALDSALFEHLISRISKQGAMHLTVGQSQSIHLNSVAQTLTHLLEERIMEERAKVGRLFCLRTSHLSSPLILWNYLFCFPAHRHFLGNWTYYHEVVIPSSLKMISITKSLCLYSNKHGYFIVLLFVSMVNFHSAHSLLIWVSIFRGFLFDNRELSLGFVQLESFNWYMLTTYIQLFLLSCVKIYCVCSYFLSVVFALLIFLLLLIFIRNFIWSYFIPSHPSCLLKFL